jgi:hypothetical protein
MFLMLRNCELRYYGGRRQESDFKMNLYWGFGHIRADYYLLCFEGKFNPSAVFYSCRNGLLFALKLLFAGKAIENTRQHSSPPSLPSSTLLLYLSLSLLYVVGDRLYYEIALVQPQVAGKLTGMFP